MRHGVGLALRLRLSGSTPAVIDPLKPLQASRFQSHSAMESNFYLLFVCPVHSQDTMC